MATFQFVVTIECDTIEQAEQVSAERLNYDEDYGFPYTISQTTETVEVRP